MLNKKKKESAKKVEKATFTLGRVLFILILIAANCAIWAYFSYRVRVICDGFVYAKRAQEQAIIQKFIPRPQKQKKVVIDAIAVVGGVPVTLEEVQEMVQDTPQLAELPFEEIYPKLLDMLINNRVVMQGAKEAGVFERPEVRKQLRLALEQIVGQTYLDELLRSHITEEEMRNFYNNEVKNFRREEEIHARHILVKTEKEAQDLLVQLKAGANFAELADKKSLDENTEGGDLGYFTKSMMIPEFGDAVFDMKKGQLSDPIKTPFGWHVVFIEDKRLANPPAFEDVREDIERALMETKLPSVLEEERERFQVQILRPTI